MKTFTSHKTTAQALADIEDAVQFRRLPPHERLKVVMQREALATTARSLDARRQNKAKRAEERQRMLMQAAKRKAEQATQRRK